MIQVLGNTDCLGYLLDNTPFMNPLVENLRDVTHIFTVTLILSLV